MVIAIYIRVSTGLQVSEGTSLEVQEELCRKRIKELGINGEVVVYKEEGVSGEDINRPQMDKLRSDVANGLIDVIICTHPDRLSRDMTDKLIVCREFEKHNTDLLFVDTEYKNTPEGQLFFNMQSAIAQYELSLIRKRTVRGRLRAVEKEQKIMPMRVAPYGYDLIDGQLIINEEEAKYVKMIYQWYVYDHLTLRDIGEKLYNLGAIPKRGESKNWNASSIGRIVNSEIYIGKYSYNKRKTSKVKGEKTKSGNPKKTYEIRDESEWIYVDVPAIVDKQLFELAQQQRLQNTKNSGNVKHNYLLRSLIRCSHCGRMWQCTYYPGRNKDTKYFCYRCPNKYPKKYGDGIVKCPTGSIKAELLDEHVWDLIIDTITKPDLFTRIMENKSNQKNVDIENTIVLLRKQIESKEKEKDKIKIMFRRDAISEDEMVNDMTKLNNEIQMIQKDIELLEDKMNVKQAEKTTKERLIDMIQQTRTIIKEYGSEIRFETKQHIIQSYITEVNVKYVDDKPVFSFVGDLNTLLSV